jgi:hypothetical protein
VCASQVQDRAFLARSLCGHVDTRRPHTKHDWRQRRGLLLPCRHVLFLCGKFLFVAPNRNDLESRLGCGPWFIRLLFSARQTGPLDGWIQSRDRLRLERLSRNAEGLTFFPWAHHPTGQAPRGPRFAHSSREHKKVAFGVLRSRSGPLAGAASFVTGRLDGAVARASVSRWPAKKYSDNAGL